MNFSGKEKGTVGTVRKCANDNDEKKKIFLCQRQSFLIRRGQFLLVFPLKLILKKGT